MKDAELKRIAREMRAGILGKRTSHRMCMAVSAPLQAFLSALYDFETELEVVDFGTCNHAWLRLPDGRILDPTADQFGLDKIYLGPVPPMYLKRSGGLTRGAGRRGGGDMEYDLKSDHSDLTPAQVAALSLQMRCCFYVMPWNNAGSPQTIREWAELIGWFAFREYEDSEARAVVEAERLFAFVSSAAQARTEGVTNELYTIKTRVIIFAGQLAAWGFHDAAKQLMAEIIQGPVNAPDYEALLAELEAARKVVEAVRRWLEHETSLLPVEKADVAAVGAVLDAVLGYDRAARHGRAGE